MSDFEKPIGRIENPLELQVKPDYIFVQASGRPILEASAIACTKEFEVVAVYHEYAAYGETSSQSWMMKHVHGLDPDYLQINGFSSSMELKNHFISWLSAFPDAELFSNSYYTHKILNRAVSLTNYKGWVERQSLIKLPSSSIYVEGYQCLYQWFEVHNSGTLSLFFMAIP